LKAYYLKSRDFRKNPFDITKKYSFSDPFSSFAPQSQKISQREALYPTQNLEVCQDTKKSQKKAKTGTNGTTLSPFSTVMTAVWCYPHFMPW